METLPSDWPNRTRHLLSYYQERTSQFTRWAMHNARIRGCPEDILTPGSSPAYPLAIKNYGPLSQWMAAYDDPPIVIPLVQLAALNSAIHSRREYSAILIKSRDISIGSETTGDSKENLSDSTHAFFTKLLESVLEMLLPRLESNPELEPNYLHREELMALFARWRPQQSAEDPDVRNTRT